mgnify:CR=1 FL=1|tara:strand:+ start:3035 stop:4225 length:1191 start_codon:yes stop_codon:yes gene_type:complete
MSLFTPNTETLDSFFEKAKYLMAWRIALVFCIVFTILAAIFVTTSTPVTIILLTVIVLSLASLVYLKFTKKFDHLFWIFITCGTILIHYSINTIPTFTHFVDFFWIISIILVAFFGLGKEVGFGLITIHGIGIIYFYLFNLNHHLEVIQPQTQIQLMSGLIEISLALFCITYLLSQYLTFNTYFSKELEKSNIELSNKNEENTVLVKEIHHRVKNNLQIIISLLRLQKGELESDEAKKHFNEAINRIMVMSLIHKKLYQEAEMAHIEIKLYLTDLSNDIIKISKLSSPIKFTINSEIDIIGLKTIVPIGLLVNELLSNSIKHAFINMSEGLISINLLAGEENNYILKYEDNGKWIEQNPDYTGFGLGLIETLTEQLEGSFIRNKSEYTFTIKNLDI